MGKDLREICSAVRPTRHGGDDAIGEIRARAHLRAGPHHAAVESCAGIDTRTGTD